MALGRKCIEMAVTVEAECVVSVFLYLDCDSVPAFGSVEP